MKNIINKFLKVKSLASFCRFGLRFRMFITYVLLIIFPLGIFAYLSESRSTTNLENKSISYLQQINKQTLKNIDRNIYELDRITLIPYFDDYIINNLKEMSLQGEYSFKQYYYNMIIHQFFFNYIQTKKEIWGITIFSAEGDTQVSIYRNKDTDSYNATSELWFKKVTESHAQRVILGQHISRNQNIPVIAVARSIIDIGTDKTLGVILIEQTKEEIGKVINDINPGEKGTVIIMDQDNTIIYCTRQLPKGFEDGLNFSRHYITMNISGEDYIVVSTVSSDTEWKAITMVPMSEFKKDSLILRRIMFYIAVICIIMAMFVSFIFIAYITRPIITLQRFMKRVEKGDFNVQMSIKRRDEIGDLSKGFNSMVTEIRKLIHSEYNLRILRKEAELNALQAQINPHFLYNTLDSLRGIAIYERAYKAASMVENLSYLLRYSLNKDGYVVTLAAEIENVKKYVDIQNLRFNNKYDIIFEVEPSFMDVRILRLTLQPIVENSIIHGLEGKKGKGRIIVKVSSIEDNIIIEVIDDGLGMDDQKLTEVNQHLRSENIGHSIVKGGKVGIFNVNERIKHYFGDKYGIEISSIKGKGTEVRIKIPFLKS